MAQYKAPGVYVEEVPSSTRPIQGVGTSTAGFIGRTYDIVMPETPESVEGARVYYTEADINDPKKLTSWEDFKNNFGDFQEGNKELAHGVYGFFNNGGTVCWVVKSFIENEDAYQATKSIFADIQSADGQIQAIKAEVDAMEDAQVEDARTKADEALTLLLTIRDEVDSDYVQDFIDAANAILEASDDIIDNPPAATAPTATEITNAVDLAAVQTIVETISTNSSHDLGVVAEHINDFLTPTATNYNAAVDTFDKIDEISILAAPGVTDSAVQNQMLTQCQTTKDRFAILDGVQDPADYITTPANICGANKSDGGYGAVYFPWIEVNDPVTGEVCAVAPSGHMAGIYASVDSDRGVHKAPANVSVIGALGTDKAISKIDHGELNDVDINVIREMNGSIRVMGARTWHDENSAEYTYINVRRLMNAIRESIEEGTQWVVFEPNDEPLWKKIKRNVTAYLTNVWRDGGLFGESASEAFYVKCDGETNPVEVREQGRVVTEIGLSMVKPAEFIVFKISQS